MTRTYSLLLFQLFLVSFISFGQNPLPRIVTLEDFIGTNENFSAYDIEVDKRGYVFVATNAGVLSFNGFKLNHDNLIYDHASDLFTYALYKDYDGDIWLNSLKQGIFYFKKDSLINFDVPDSILSLASGGFENIYQDKNGLLHIAPRNHGYFTIDSEGRVNEIISRRNAKVKGFAVTQLSDGSWFHFSIATKLNSDSTMSVYQWDAKQGFKKILNTEQMIPVYESSLVQHSDGSLSFSMGTDLLIRIKKGKLIESHQFDFKIIKLFVDSRNDLWIGTFGQGAMKAENSDLTNLTRYYKGNFAAVAESENGGLWLKSDDIGLGYIPQNSTKHYSDQNGYKGISEVVSVNIVHDKILFLPSDFRLRVLQGNRIEYFGSESGIHELDIRANYVCYDYESDTYWLVSRGNLYRYNGKDVTKFDLNQLDMFNTKVTCIKSINGRIIGTTKTNVFEVKGDEVVCISERSEVGYILDLTIDNEGNIWLGTNKGMRILKERIISELTYKTDNLNETYVRVTNAMGFVWGINLKYDLVKFDLDGREIIHYEDGTKPDIFNLTKDEKGNLWAMDIRSNLINISSSKNSTDLQITKYSIPDHYTNHQTRYSLAVFQERVYIGSGQGLFEIPMDQLQEESEWFKLNFKLFINQEEVDFSFLNELDYFENDIRLEFDAISFDRKSMSFSYMLDGYDDDWQDAKYKEIRYTNLNPGSYQLKFRTKISGSDWGEPQIISFTIQAPFWHTNLFRVLMAVLGLLIFGAIIVLRVSYVRKKEREKAQNILEKTNLEMRALKSQLNPHFIFNSISSAMFYISKNENDKAESYLQRFTKVMRGILENSEESEVLLIQEVKLMQQYVSLESEQIEGEPINLEVSYSNLKPEQITIPPTIIQPYIENSIQHGLKTKKGKRVISLSFSRVDQQLKVTIEDNGIGREAAKQLNQRQAHKSFGMLISSRRIALLNQETATKVMIEDLKNSNGVCKGTSVQFMIPLLTLNDR